MKLLQPLNNFLPPFFFVEQQDYETRSENNQEDTKHSTNSLASPWKTFMCLGLLICLVLIVSWIAGGSSNVNWKEKIYW